MNMVSEVILSSQTWGTELIIILGFCNLIKNYLMYFRTQTRLGDKYGRTQPLIFDVVLSLISGAPRRIPTKKQLENGRLGFDGLNDALKLARSTLPILPNSAII